VERDLHLKSLEHAKRLYEDPDFIEELLKVSIENRKLEIELLWKRTVIFWGFISALFLVLYHVSSTYKLGICSIGFLFSVIWTLVNKGSKAWQQSWENKAEFYSRIRFRGYELLYKKAHEYRDEEWEDPQRSWVKKFGSFLRKLAGFQAMDYSMSKLLIALSNFYVLIWIGAFLRYSSIPYFINFITDNDIGYFYLAICFVYAIITLISCKSNTKNNAPDVFRYSRLNAQSLNSSLQEALEPEEP
jgi:hypothetical protein